MLNYDRNCATVCMTNRRYLYFITKRRNSIPSQEYPEQKYAQNHGRKPQPSTPKSANKNKHGSKIIQARKHKSDDVKLLLDIIVNNCVCSACVSNIDNIYIF